jgi:hypothetical protein
MGTRIDPDDVLAEGDIVGHAVTVDHADDHRHPVDRARLGPFPSLH